MPMKCEPSSGALQILCLLWYQDTTVLEWGNPVKHLSSPFIIALSKRATTIDVSCSKCSIFLSLIEEPVIYEHIDYFADLLNLVAFV